MVRNERVTGPVRQMLPFYVRQPHPLDKNEGSCGIRPLQSILAARRQPLPPESRLWKLTESSEKGTSLKGILRAFRVLGISHTLHYNLTVETFRQGFARGHVFEIGCQWFSDADMEFSRRNIRWIPPFLYPPGPDYECGHWTMVTGMSQRAMYVMDSDMAAAVDGLPPGLRRVPITTFFERFWDWNDKGDAIEQVAIEIPLFPRSRTQFARKLLQRLLPPPPDPPPMTAAAFVRTYMEAVIMNRPSYRGGWEGGMFKEGEPCKQRTF